MTSLKGTIFWEWEHVGNLVVTQFSASKGHENAGIRSQETNRSSHKAIAVIQDFIEGRRRDILHDDSSSD